MICSLDGVLALLRILHGRATVNLAGREMGDCERARDRLRIALPAPTIPPEEPKVSFSFSWKTDHGSMRTSRTLDVLPWNEIASNYPRGTRAALQDLFRRFRPNRSGQTIV